MVKVQIIQPNTTYRFSLIISVVDQLSKYEVCGWHFMVYTVYYIFYIHIKIITHLVYDSCGLYHLFSIHRNMSSPLPFTLKCRGLRTNSTIRVFHLKVITSHDMRICINIHITLIITVANVDCEGFSIIHIFYLFVFYHILPSLLSHLFYGSI